MRMKINFKLSFINKKKKSGGFQNIFIEKAILKGIRIYFKNVFNMIKYICSVSSLVLDMRLVPS